MTDTIVTQTPYFPRTFIAQLVDGIVGIIEILLAFRIGLEFFGANPSSPFVAWIYQVSGSLLGPFAGAFQSMPSGPNSVIDVTAILAMIAYAVVGWIVLKVIFLLLGSTTTTTTTTTAN